MGKHVRVTTTIFKGECSFPPSPQWDIILLLYFRPRKIMYSLNGSNDRKVKGAYKVPMQNKKEQCLVELPSVLFERESILVCWQSLNKQKTCSSAEIPQAGTAWRLKGCLGTDKLVLCFFFSGYWLLTVVFTKSWAKWILHQTQHRYP